MKIAATAVGMEAARTYKEVEQRTSSFSSKTGSNAQPSFDDFRMRISRSLNSSSSTQFTGQSVVSRVSGGSSPMSQGENELGAKMADLVLSQLTERMIGKSVRIIEVTDNPVQSVKWAELTYATVYRQEERINFSAQGRVQTTDGREIAFNLGLSMERNTIVTDSASIGFPTFIDPLVLQFEAAPAFLGDSIFLFDLNGDGVKEQLACPGKGCGFLAFDRNNDGIINNGLELFGPTTGAGFCELADLDKDANQWIDENDPIFDSLMIWSPDGLGGESLRSLREAGVGAISVVHSGSTFQLENSAGNILGTVKASGIFLTEAGEVRSLQEIDLAAPAMASATNPSGWPPARDRQEVALQMLRNIISMQQFRLKMMLTEQRLLGTSRKIERRQWLLDWLENRSEWSTMTHDRDNNLR
ncbi:MAG: hypothetical protein V2B20_10275 [Pseudomonadota bacterium]